jgi:hypothetical protein
MKKLAGLPAKFHSTGFRRTPRSPTGIGGALIRPRVMEGVMEGREGWRVMEGRGSDGGGGNGGAGPSLLTMGARRPGVGGCRRL